MKASGKSRGTPKSAMLASLRPPCVDDGSPSSVMESSSLILSQPLFWLMLKSPAVMACTCSAQGVALLESVVLLEQVCHCGCGL